MDKYSNTAPSITEHECKSYTVSEELLSSRRYLNQPYLYEDLQHPDTIRLLELLPAAEGFPTTCRLSEVLLPDVVNTYEPLSYAWGEPVLSEALYEVSTGGTIMVTRNLHHGLQAVRHHKPQLHGSMQSASIKEASKSAIIR